jgi:hypothetical protein
VERVNNASCLPMCVIMQTHISKMWTLRLSDCMDKALDAAVYSQTKVRMMERHDSLPQLSSLIEDGVLIVFELKDFSPKASEQRATAAPSSSQPQVKARADEDEAKRPERAGDEDQDEEDDDDVYEDYDEYYYRRSLKLGSGIVNADSKQGEGKTDDDEIDELKQSLQYNPLQATFPTLFAGSKGDSDAGAQPKYVALLLTADSRAMSILQQARMEWRNAARMHDVPDIRGFTTSASSSEQPSSELTGGVPVCILRSLLTAIDSFSYGVKNAMQAIDPIKSSISGSALTGAGADGSGDETASFGSGVGVAATLCLSTAAASFVHGCGGISCLLGAGYSTMRAVHTVSEAQRLALAASQEGAAEAADGAPVESARPHPRVALLPVFGVAGSGVQAFAHQLQQRFAAALTTAYSSVTLHTLDLVALARQADNSNVVNFMTLLQKRLSDIQTDIEADAGRIQAGVVLCVVPIVTSASLATLPLQLLTTLQSALQARALLSVFSVVSADSLGINDVSTAADDALGAEVWRTSSRVNVPPGLCEYVVVVEGASSKSASVVGKVKSWLASSHGDDCERAVTVLRCVSSMLRLDDDTFESLETAFNTFYRSSEKLEADMSVPHYLDGCLTVLLRNGLMRRSYTAPASAGPAVPCARPSHSLSDGMAGIQTLRVASPADGVWDMTSLGKALQLLFPRAVYAGVTLQTEKLIVPAATTASPAGSGNSFMNRLLQLAKVKVLRQRQREEASKVFKAGVVGIVARHHQRVFDRMLEHVYTVHGQLSLQRDSQGGDKAGPWTVSVEANASNIIIREVPPAAGAGSASNWLYVQGSVGAAERDLLTDLFAMCAPFHLKPLRRLTNEDVGSAARADIQKNLLQLFSRPAAPGSKFSPPKQMQQNSNSSAFTSSTYLTSGSPLTDEGSSTDRSASTDNNDMYNHDGTLDVSLPGGWAFDGVRYVHITGKTEALRPDIEYWVGKYVDLKNRKVDQYNATLAEVLPYLVQA